MSATDVSYLAPGQTVRGALSDDPNKYKVYEFYVNKMQFPDPLSSAKMGGVDLFITLTACTGNVRFFISDDFRSLFTAQSKMESSTKVTTLDATVEHVGEAISVEHKRSKLS